MSGWSCVRAVSANFVLMPLGALALAKVLWLDNSFGIGLLLLGCAAGAPFLPKLAELAKGNLAFAVGAMVLLMVVTVGLPAYCAAPNCSRELPSDPWNIARSLVPAHDAPTRRRTFPEGALRRLGPSSEARTRLDFQRQPHPTVLFVTAANIDKVLQVFGTREILAGLLLVALGLGIGWLLGGPDGDTRRVLALGTSQRNIGAALVVASQSFSDPKVIVMVIVVAIVGLIILVPLARALANR